MKQQGKMKIAELQYPKQHDDEQSREAYLIVKIKSSEKNVMKSSILFSKFYLNQTHVKLIDIKFLSGTVG